MSNSLYRFGRLTYVPAVPPTPYQPAYTSTITNTVQSIQANGSSSSQSSPVSGGYWAYQYFTDPDTFKTTREMVFIPAPVTSSSGSSGGGYSVGGGSTNTTATTTTTVYHPEVPATPGSPAMTVEYPPRGWTSFARSIAVQPGTASMSFRVKANVTGVAVGFMPASQSMPSTGYGHLRDGLLFTNNTVALLRSGATLGAYVESDEFTIKRKHDGTVIVQRNGTDIDTRTTQDSLDLLATPTTMAVAMYATGDALYDPEFLAIAGGSATLSLPAMTTLASNYAMASSSMTLPTMVLTAGGGLGGYVVLPAMQMFAGEGSRAEAVASLPALELLAYGGTLPVTTTSGADMTTPAMVMSGILLVGSTGQSAMTLPAMTLMAANRVYGEARMTMPPLNTVGYDEPADEAIAFELFTVAHPAAGTSIDMVIAMDGVTVGATAVSTAVIDAAMTELLTASSTVATEQLLDAIARAFIQAGSTGVLETTVGRTDLDTPVWHDQANGSTMYRGYSFNSFAQIGGKYYGANSDGLFLLEGGNDAGVPIHASIDLGRLDFKTAEKKTISQCYLGMAADGNLVLKVIAEGKEYLYKTRSFSTEMQQQRITTGKGLKTNYITAQFFNEDGADFEIDSVRFFVADLTRRIN